MCGRFSLTATPEEMRALFGHIDRADFPPRYNIAPTQPIAIVRLVARRRRLALVRWGLLPAWVKDPSDFPLLVNARAETAAAKPAFRAAMRHRRCLVPADGFYEWRKGEGASQPFWVRPRSGGLVAFAGLWETWTDGDGGTLETAAILTTPANRTIAPIHSRMPAVIPATAFARWLDTTAHSPADVAPLLAPPPDDLFEAIPVSRRVNRISNDDASLHRPVTPAAPPTGGGAQPREPRARRGDRQGELF